MNVSPQRHYCMNSVNKESNFIPPSASGKWINVISAGKFYWICGLNRDFRRLRFGEGVRTRFPSRSLYCRGWLFCKWRWGLSDKAGRDERRRANTVLSSEQIQFHSINIDVLLSPANALTLHLGPLEQVIHTDHSGSYKYPSGPDV